MVAESYWPNTDGGATFARRLNYGLAKRGHQVLIWAPGRTLHSHVEQDGPTTIYREKSMVLLPNPKYRVSFFPFFSGYRLLKQVRPDIIHLNLIGWLTVPTMIYAKRYRVPVLAVNHLMAENILHNLGLRRGALYQALWHRVWHFLIWFYNKTDFVTSPTSTAITILEEQGLIVPHKAISNGLDTDYYTPGQPEAGVFERLSLPRDARHILYLGRTDGEKRIDLLVAAFAKLQGNAKLGNLHLIIAGYGNHLESLKQQARELGLADKVSFTGFVSDDDKLSLYRASTIFAISSPAELQSIVMMEAMACGLPTVAVDVAALKELCHDGQTGYLFPRDRSDIMAEKLAVILADNHLAQQLGTAGRELIVAHHSNKAMLDQYEATYRDVIDSYAKSHSHQSATTRKA